MGHNVCAMLSSFIAHNVSIGRCNHKPSSLLCRLRCELLRFGRARPLAQRDRLNILKSLYIAIIAKNDRRKEKELPIRDCQLWLSVHSSSRVLFSIVQWENWLHTHTHTIESMNYLVALQALFIGVEHTEISMYRIGT